MTKTLDFFRLSRAVQDRFLHAARGASEPRPILFRPLRGRRWLFPLLLAAVAGLSLLVVAAVDFGHLDRPLAIAPPFMACVYAALLLLALGSSWVARVRAKEPGLLPYRPGVYLFPSGVIDARVPEFRIYGLERLESCAAHGSSVELKFPEHVFRFRTSLQDPAKSRELTSYIESLKASCQAAIESENFRELARLDPLHDTGFSNPFSPKSPLARPSSRKSLGGGLGLALIVAVPLGYFGFLLRNQLSEERLFATANALNTTKAYRAYLERGGQREEVSAELLPRAELALAVKANTVSAILDFSARHPKSRIQAEVTRALKAALLTQLAEARQQASLARLTDFKQKFSEQSALFESEYRRAVDDYYSVTLENYRKSPLYSNKTDAFVSALINYTRQGKGAAEVRFKRVLRESLTTADQQVQKSAYYLGPLSLPAQYFDASHSEPREAEAARILADKWQQLLPVEIVRFEPGAPVEQPEGAPVGFDVPTLLVEYVVGTAGIYLNKKPRGAFVGVGLVFTARFTIPDSKESLEFKWSSWKVPDVASLGRGESTVGDVYITLAQEAFSRFIRQYEAEYF